MSKKSFKSTMKVGDVVPDGSGRRLNPLGRPCTKLDRSIIYHNMKHGLSIKIGDSVKEIISHIKSKDLAAVKTEVETEEETSQEEIIKMRRKFLPREVYVFVF